MAISNRYYAVVEGRRKGFIVLASNARGEHNGWAFDNAEMTFNEVSAFIKSARPGVVIQIDCELVDPAIKARQAFNQQLHDVYYGRTTA